MSDLTCDECQSLLAELALGVVHGRERADALNHVEHCPACQHELLLMGDLADRLVELTPSAEPPAGFETRVLAALGPADAAPAGHRARPGRRSSKAGAKAGQGRLRQAWFRPAAVSLVAAAVAAAVAVGGWDLGHHSSNPPAVASGGGKPVVAELLADRHDVGQVVMTGKPYRWVSMAVETGLGNQWVTCQLKEQNGKTITIGSFRLHGGTGYWAAAVPATTSPVTQAQLVSHSGSTVATAALPTTA